MATNNTDLNIIIEVITKGEERIAKIENDVAKMGNSVNRASKSTKDIGVATSLASGNMRGFATAIGLGTIGAVAAIAAFNKLQEAVNSVGRALKDVGEAGVSFARLQETLEVVAGNAGISSEEINKMSEALAEANLFGAQATETMLTFVQSGLGGIVDMERFVLVAKDYAASIGVSSRQGVEDFAKALGMLSPELLDNYRLTLNLNEVYKDYADTIGVESANALDGQQKRMAFLNAIFREHDKTVTGVYKDTYDTASKAISSFNDAVRALKDYLGLGLEPAIKAVALTLRNDFQAALKWVMDNKDKFIAIGETVGNAIKQMITNIRNFFDRNKDILTAIVTFATRVGIAIVSQFRQIFNVFQLFINAFEAGIRTIVQGAKVVVAALEGDFKGASDAGKVWASQIQQITNEAVGNFNDFIDASADGLKSHTFNLKDWWENISAVDGAGWDSRLNEAIEGGRELTQAEKDRLAKTLELNEKYQRDLEKVNKQYRGQLEDLVIAHRDAYKSLKDDIEDAKKALREKLQDEKKAYGEAMSDMTEAHGKKTRSILEDIEEERKALKREVEDISEEWNTLISLTQQSGAERLANLQAQLDRELALGDSANRDKINALQQLINKENQALEDATAEQVAKKEKEIGDMNEIYNDRISNLTRELKEENDEYGKAMIKRRIEYEKDVENYKKSTQEKLNDLNEKLKIEKDIRNKYAEDFKRVGDKIAEDDITRLKKKHDEELREMEFQYQKQLSRLGEAVDTEVGMVNRAEREKRNAIEETNRTIEKQIDLFSSVGSGWNSTNSSPVAPDFYNWSKSFGFGQHGGIISSPTIIGEKNYPEVVLPLNEPQRMQQILSSLGISGGAGGKSVEQHFHITVNSVADIDTIMERAAFNIKYK